MSSADCSHHFKASNIWPCMVEVGNPSNVFASERFCQGLGGGWPGIGRDFID